MPQQLKSYEAYYDSNLPLIDPKKTVKYHKKKDTRHNLLSPNPFSTLDFNNDLMIMENNCYDKDPGNYAKEKVILGHQYVQLKNTYRNTFINNA